MTEAGRHTSLTVCNGVDQTLIDLSSLSGHVSTMTGRGVKVSRPVQSRDENYGLGLGLQGLISISRPDVSARSCGQNAGLDLDLEIAISVQASSEAMILVLVPVLVSRVWYRSQSLSRQFGLVTDDWTRVQCD